MVVKFSYASTSEVFIYLAVISSIGHFISSVQSRVGNAKSVIERTGVHRDKRESRIGDLIDHHEVWFESFRRYSEPKFGPKRRLFPL